MRTLEEIEKEIKKLNDEKREVENANKEKLKKEKDDRKKELDDAYTKYLKLRQKYIEDYGIHNIWDNKDDDTIWKLSFLDF